MVLYCCLKYCTCCLSARTIRRARQQQAVDELKNAKIVITKIEKPKRSNPPPTAEQIGEAFAKLDTVMTKMKPAIAEARITIPATGNIVSVVANSAPVLVDAVSSAIHTSDSKTNADELAIGVTN